MAKGSKKKFKKKAYSVDSAPDSKYKAPPLQLKRQQAEQKRAKSGVEKKVKFFVDSRDLLR